MLWPSPKDFNDAIRNPSAAFTDPDLAGSDPVVGANGRPTPHAGESSSVYQLCAEDGRSWAVKCFARLYDQRGARYAVVREALAAGVAPFAVAFEYLEGGVKVGGKRWPVLKMDWVEGLPLNHVARDRADSPAVMDGLFKQWVKLASALRTAGMAHGDLQHGNVILVPGRWPGSYTLKLVDYDGAYLPALAHEPSYETGHANYQHPDRNERSYSPDLDRFPLLVVATALKGLAVRGPDLWKRFGGGDNMLFTAKDFRDPSGSKLMQKMWRSKDATLRALVGNLALACLKPLAQTPWLDDLVLEGSDPRLTDETARAVQAVLGSGSRAVVSLSEAFTLDDEPARAAVPALLPAEVVEPVEEPRPAPALVPAEVVSVEESKPAARPAATKPLTPVPVLTDDEDEEDGPRPRGRAKRREPESRPFPLVALAVVAGLMLVAGAVVAGVLVGRAEKPDETAQPRPDEHAPPPAVDPTPSKPEPKPEPKKEPEPVAGPPGFHKVWTKLIADERTSVNLDYHPNGQTVYMALSGRIEALDAKTGNARVQFRPPPAPFTVAHMWTLDRDRFAACGIPAKAPVFWDARTGDLLPSPLTRDPLPPPPPGIAPFAIECQLSPDGQYVFAGYQGPLRGPGAAPAPYRVVEVATGKVIAQGDWTFGTARFTADSSRMLMTETNGRVRWIKTATGETEIEWAFQPNLFPRMISGMSADGSLFLYHGRPGTLPQDNYLTDGKTGQVLRRLGSSFPGDRCVLSADGRWLAGVGTEAPNFNQVVAFVADARSGEVIVRTPIEGEMRGIMRAAFTPDGKAFVLHNRLTHEIVAYELRGALKPVEGAAIPAPLTLVPERAPPLGPGAALGPAPLPPPVGPPPVRPPKGALPEAPALKARWTVGVDVKDTTNQLPQAPVYSRDGRTVILTGGMAGTVLTFDAKTGAAGAVFDGHKGPAGVAWLFPVGDDRVASGGFDAKYTIWDMKTGKPIDDVKFPELPPWPVGRGHAGITRAVSPTARYTLAARKEAGRPAIPGPLRVLDTTTGKEIISAAWNGGFVSFTADESRLLVLDGLSKATWFKLPSGEVDVEWQTGERVQTQYFHVPGLSSDGRTILYHGPLGDQPVGVYLLEGNTGKVIRRLNSGAPYQVSTSGLSPDGKHVAMGVIDFPAGVVWHLDVFEVATWRLVGRVSPPENNAREHPHFAFSPDGKELAVFFRAAKRMSVFPLPAE